MRKTKTPSKPKSERQQWNLYYMSPVRVAPRVFNLQRPEKLIMLRAALFFFMVAIAGHLYFFATKITSLGSITREFAQINLLYGLAFSAPFIIVFVLARTPLFGKKGRKTTVVPPIEFVPVTRFGGITTIMAVSFLSAITALLIQLVIALILEPQQFNITQQELYFYYMFTAISEEILFRFVILTILFSILTEFLGSIGGHAAIIITGVFFMLLHLGVYGSSPSALSATLAIGIFFGYVYIVSDNILNVIIGHMINNLAAVIIAPPPAIIEESIFSPYGGNDIGTFLVVYGLMMAVVVVLVVIYAIYKKYIEKQSEQLVNSEVV